MYPVFLKCQLFGLIDSILTVWAAAIAFPSFHDLRSEDLSSQIDTTVLSSRPSLDVWTSPGLRVAQVFEETIHDSQQTGMYGSLSSGERIHLSFIQLRVHKSGMFTQRNGSPHTSIWSRIERGSEISASGIQLNDRLFWIKLRRRWVNCFPLSSCSSSLTLSKDPSSLSAQNGEEDVRLEIPLKSSFQLSLSCIICSSSRSLSPHSLSFHLHHFIPAPSFLLPFSPSLIPLFFPLLSCLWDKFTDFYPVLPFHFRSSTRQKTVSRRCCISSRETPFSQMFAVFFSPSTVYRLLLFPILPSVCLLFFPLILLLFLNE